MQERNYGFGPISVKRDDSKKLVILAELGVIIICILLLVIYRTFTGTTDVWPDIFTLCCFVSSLIFCELIRRCCLFAEECRHIDERYGGSWKEAIYACLSLSKQGGPEICLVFFVFAAYATKLWVTSDGMYAFPIAAFIITKIIHSIGWKFLGLSYMCKVEKFDMIECDSNNVAEGLAWVFYFNYLKHVLPKLDAEMFQQAHGDEYKIDGEDIRDKVTDKRLFIVIPNDGYCYKTLDEVDDRIRLSPKKLPPIEQSRGFTGGKKRTYRQSLYEVSPENLGSQKYVVMEYASPLLTLYDMSMNAKVKFSEQDRKHQITLFYKKLKEILEADHGCKNMYNLLLTGPGAEKHNKEQRKLADILYDEIKP